MRAFALLFLLLLAACPQQVGQQCPPNTAALGEYTVNRIGSSASGQCIATPDGGSATPLTLADAGQIGATFCLGSGSDGGPQLQLVISGKQTQPSDLLADGGFHFTGHADAVSTLCACPVADDESFDGFLTTTAAGPVAIQPDGGLPPITGLTATITDVLSTDAGTTGCLCTLPCPVIYSISGTRF